MATGDITVWTDGVTSGDVAFQPSSGVQMNIKTCAGGWVSATEYLTLENDGGYGIKRTNVANFPRSGAIGDFAGFDGGDQVEYFGNVLVTNSSYIQFDGEGTATKYYYVAGIQTD
jgi:hypothetical protein